MARNTPQPPISRTLHKILILLLAALYIAGSALNFTLANTSRAHGATAPAPPSPTPPVDTPYSCKAALHRFPNGTLLDTFEPRISRIIARALVPDSLITSANTALPEAIDAAMRNVLCVELILMRRGWSARDEKYAEKHMQNLLEIMEWLEGESEMWGGLGGKEA